MKINNLDKIIIALLALLIIGDVFVISNNYIKTKKKNLFIITAPSSETKPLPKDIKKNSKKYKTYPELFNNDKKVFTYNYNTNELDIKNNWLFHKELTKKLKEKNLNYEYIIYKNQNIERNANADGEKCNAIIVLNSTHQEIVDIVEKCMLNSCIIDNKNNTYTIIDRKPDDIIKFLEDENTPKK